MSTAILRTPDGDLDVLNADLALPITGNWIAHGALREPSAPTGPASLLLTGTDGTTNAFNGFIRRSGEWAGAAEARFVLVGGAGGLARTIGPSDHAKETTVLLVAQGIANVCGEQLAPEVADELAGLTVPRWLRAEGTGLEAIGLLAQELTLDWRVLDSGLVWFGLTTFPVVDDAVALGDQPMVEDHDDGRFDARPSSAALRPGVTCRERQITCVTYRVSPDVFTVEALYSVSGEPARPILPVVYRQTHGARVVSQNADGTLELVVDDARILGLSRVPFRVGVPGARVIIPANSRVRCAFENGSAQGVFAFGLDQDPSAAKGVVRVGDAGVGGSFSAVGVAPGAPIQFVYVGPDGVTISAPTVQIATKATQGSTEVFIK